MVIKKFDKQQFSITQIILFVFYTQASKKKTILELVENLSVKVDILTKDVKFLIEIVRRTSIIEEAETNPQLDSLPCRTHQEVINLEEKLQAVEFFNVMVNILQGVCIQCRILNFILNFQVASLLSVGGKDSPDSIRRLMTVLLSHDASLLYNWTGTGKLAFGQFKNIIKMILGKTRYSILILTVLIEFFKLFLEPKALERHKIS